MKNLALTMLVCLVPAAAACAAGDEAPQNIEESSASGAGGEDSVASGASAGAGGGAVGSGGGDSGTSGSGAAAGSGSGSGTSTGADGAGSGSTSTGAGASGGGSSSAATGGGPGSSSSSGGGNDFVPVLVKLVPQSGVSGLQRVNFAVPLAPGQLGDAGLVRVLAGGADVPAGRRALAKHPDGSIRSVQLQLDLSIQGETTIEVHVGEAPSAGEVALVPVTDTLVSPDGTKGPRVWAILPADWLSASGFAGPLVTEEAVAGTPLAAWNELCDYDENDIGSFLSQQYDGAVWLYDRGTTMYRGHARRGDLGTLESAYRETAIYRAGLSGSGGNLAIPVPGKSGDLKYYYGQNLALHYLMTGDDRFREAAEDMAFAASQLWSPKYDGGAKFWTERHAGFLLLAHVWGMTVSDDQAAAIQKMADAAVDAYIDVLETYPKGYDDDDARCFAHSADAHGEGYGNFGCSPWMSAILADALDAYATVRGGSNGEKARGAIVKLGRILAENGRDKTGRPYYWMGVGNDGHVVDDYAEHYGESAYVIAMAWYHGGKKEPALEQAAYEIVAELGDHGEAPHMRSFNWQCRSAVATPFFLK